MSFLVAEMTSALVSYSVLQTANKKISGVKVVLSPPPPPPQKKKKKNRPSQINPSLTLETTPVVSFIH